MKRVAVVVGLLLVALGLLGVSSAATLPLAGDLDPSFGSGGVVRQPPGSSIAGIAVQPDGKIVVAGNSKSGFVLARYLSDGSLDPSFGTGGHVETDVDGISLGALALQPDGKIVVAAGSAWGSVSDQFTLARYDSDGSLDTSFGTDGFTNTAIPVPSHMLWDARMNALAVLSDGKILVAGTPEWDDGAGSAASFALARYTPAGSIDSTFGDDGIVQTPFGGSAYLDGIVVQQDGKIVATGSSVGPGHGIYFEQMALAGYEPDGSLDPAFGGEVTTPKKLHYYGGPATLEHGKIVVAGYIERGSKAFPVVARYGVNGLPDPSFGKNGFALVKRDLLPTAVLAQNDGKMLIASGNSGTVLRLLPDGRLDTSFGRRGIVSLNAALSSVALQPDGKILVGGGELGRLVGGNNCVVPDLRGRTVGKASAILERSYCQRGSISKRFSRSVTRGRVISTALQRGARLPSGARVNLVVSKGKRP
jgi:uncharacterized delta-60 repeat protein